ncbi:MAG: DUF1674 domain-containing protein [Wenzhouxiangella sp.]|jgi:hypothetical protein|nr:DUF1674 domain-containing protein [Wenzhouxiangella sp.]
MSEEANRGEQPPEPNDPPAAPADTEKEIGGRRDGLDPTRYGDWEKNGRCIDF